MNIATLNSSAVIATGASIEMYRLSSVRAQLRMEAAGMKARGGALRPRLAKEFGLSPRAPHLEYIAKIEERLVPLRAAVAAAQENKAQCS